MEQYYVDIDGQTAGPFNLEELRGLFLTGKVDETNLYAKQGSVEWRPLADLSSILIPARPKAPAPVGNGAVIGAWVCLAISFIAIFIPFFPTFWIYLPLLVVVFVLSIVAMAQKQLAHGLALLLFVLVGSPIAVAASWFVGLSSLAAFVDEYQKQRAPAPQAITLTALSTNIVVQPESQAAALPKVAHSLLNPDEVAARYGRVIGTSSLGKMTIRMFRFKDYEISVLHDGERWMGETLQPKPRRKMNDDECLALAKAIAAEGEWSETSTPGLDTKWEHQAGDFMALRPLSFGANHLVVFSKQVAPLMAEYQRTQAEKMAEGF